MMDAATLGSWLAAGGAAPQLWRERWRRRSSPQGGSPDSGRSCPEHYTVVPGLGAPRLLLPAGSRRHAAAAAAAGHPSGWRARIRQQAIRACFATGVGDLLFPDRLAPGVPETLAGHLAELLGAPVRLGLRLGPQRANQKPVLVLLDDAAQVTGYAKLAVNPLTRQLLATEHAALAALAAADLRVLQVPRVQYAGRWQQADLLVLSALPVRRARPVTGSRAAPLLAAAAAELARVRPTRVTPLLGSDYLTGLGRRVGNLPADRHRALLQLVLARLAARGMWLEFGCWHGDFFAGNLALAGNRLLAWDWERFATGVPVGFDLLHHAWMAAILAGRALPAAARAVASATPSLASLDVPAERAAAVAALYLVEIATRYREDGNRAVDVRLCQPGQWLPPALLRLGVIEKDDMDGSSNGRGGVS